MDDQTIEAKKQLLVTKLKAIKKYLEAKQKLPEYINNLKSKTNKSK